MIPPLHALLLFMATGLALNLTPGPDMLYVAARGTSDERAAGVVSSLGIATGTLFHIAAVALGASRAAGCLRANSRAGETLRKATGVIFVGLGLRIAFASRS